MYFTKEQMKMVSEASDMAEDLVLSYLGIKLTGLPNCRYDLKTQKFQTKKEKTDFALAQLCKYECLLPKEFDVGGRFEFYRICLQDRLIIKTAEERTDMINLAPLLLYIITHELIHIMRFTRLEQSFDIEKVEKAKEEAMVHNLTHDVLIPVSDKKIKNLKPILENFKKPKKETVAMENHGAFGWDNLIKM